jgi:hypothetical protein
VGQGGEMTQALYAHMNNKTIKKIIFWDNLVQWATQDIQLG